MVWGSIHTLYVVETGLLHKNQWLYALSAWDETHFRAFLHVPSQQNATGSQPLLVHIVGL